MFSILKFSGTFCHPCKVLAEHLNKNPFTEAEVISVDIEDRDDLVDKYNIRHVPTLILFNTGNCKVTDPDSLDSSAEVRRWSGFVSVDQLLNDIRVTIAVHNR